MRIFFLRTWNSLFVSAALVALFTVDSQAIESAVGITTKQTQSTVRVRVVKDVDILELRVKNLAVFDRSGNRLMLSKSNAWATITLEKTGANGNPRIQVSSVAMKNKFADSDLSYPLDFYGSEITIEGKAVPSPLRVSLIQGHMSGISTLKISDYLIGVLHKEMSGKWPKEALKAQAVATRSYTLAQIFARNNEEFDLEGSVLDQDFQWVTPSERSKPEILNWQRALDETKDIILVGSDGKALKAYYHADCGGETTVPDLVWGPKGEFQSVKDPVCEKRRANHWHFSVPKSEIQRKIASEDSEHGKLKFDWVKSTFDRRVTWVEWTAGFTGTAQDAWKLISGQNFRRLLGFDKLKSTRFKAEDRGNSMYFEGQGFGHGVGLCQWGSRDWANQGWNVWKILNHYYPKAKISYWKDAVLAQNKPASREIDEIEMKMEKQAANEPKDAAKPTLLEEFNKLKSPSAVRVKVDEKSVGKVYPELD